MTIQFEHLNKTFEAKKRTVHALQDVNLTIEDGDIFGIIGFSGAGKSTLLRMINLLEEPTSGSVLIDGERIEKISKSALRQVRKKIGMIFQQFNLLNSKTVYDNIAIPLVLNKESREKIDSRVKELLKFVGLEDRAQNYPDQLSGGQKQRVGIARALATSPSILLCDEATSALDPDTTESILNLLEKVNKELGITIVFVTHEIHVIERLCNKVAVMELGRVIESGSVLDVFSDPQQEMTKRFVSTVIPNKIPDSIIAALKADKSNYRLIRIHLKAEHATEDLIWQINSKFAIRTNVMFASVHEIQGIVLSVMVLQFTGEDAEIARATDYLTSRGVEWDEVKV